MIFSTVNSMKGMNDVMRGAEGIQARTACMQRINGKSLWEKGGKNKYYKDKDSAKCMESQD